MPLYQLLLGQGQPMNSTISFALSMLIVGNIGALVRSIPLPAGEIALARGLLGALSLLPILRLTGRPFPWRTVSRHSPLIVIAGLSLACRRRSRTAHFPDEGARRHHRSLAGPKSSPASHQGRRCPFGPPGRLTELINSLPVPAQGPSPVSHPGHAAPSCPLNGAPASGRA